MATTYPRAYAFESPLTIDQMLPPLQAAGPWKWEVRDSDSLGEYVGCWPDFKGPVKVRILKDEGTFVLEVMYLERSTTNQFTRQEIEDVIQQKVLPAVQAKNVRAAEPIS
jgi:hypothetical protein